MDEAGDFFVRFKAEGVENVAVECEPAGQPVGAVAEVTMFMALAPADSSCSHGGTLGCGLVKLTTAITSGASISRRFSTSTSAARADGGFRLNTLAMISPARTRASPSNTMKRHGVSLPWSGTRAPMVRMVSSSAGEGPGPLISRGLTERRIFRRSMASGNAAHFVAEEWDISP